MENQGFGQVIGHKELIRHLKNAISSGKVSHAYIFAGEKGSGKKLLSGLFAMTLECREGGDEPCLTCESCMKAMSGNHPDIIRVTHEKSTVITVDEIRRQVVDTAPILPYESPWKVYLIDEAEKMNAQAQNALLKTIEEPPEYAVFCLLTTGTEALLPTIVSRCVVLSLKAVNDSEVRSYLKDTLHVPPYEAEIATAFAQGNVGRARETIANENLSRITRNAVSLLRHVHDMDISDLTDAIRNMTAEKQNINEYLDILTLWFRDVLLYKATKEIDNLVFKKEIMDIRDQAEKSSYEGIEEILSAIERAKTRLRANVSFELTMELLLMTIRENCDG